MPIEHILRVVLAIILIWVWLRRIRLPLRWAMVSIGTLHIIFVVLVDFSSRTLFTNQNLNLVSSTISLITLVVLIALAYQVKRD